MTIVNPVSAITYIEAAAQVRHVATLRHEAEVEDDIFFGGRDEMFEEVGAKKLGRSIYRSWLKMTR